MGNNRPDNWKNDPDFVRLMNFLIERTRDATAPMSIMQLAQEFKDNWGASQGIICLVSRIRGFHGRIIQMDWIDKAAKVRMMVALGASIDQDFLNELRKEAYVEVDWKNRIINYRAHDGGLELDGDHTQSAKVKEGWKQRKMDWDGSFDDFLIEKSKDVKSPLNLSQLAEEFKENNGASQGIICLVSRIGSFRSKIHQMDSIDTETKVKMMFALGASIDDNFLNELRKDAYVEVDWKNRILNYRGYDGSLELDGDHTQSAKVKEGWKQRKMDWYGSFDDFLIEKSKDVKSPLNLSQLAKEFKEKSGSSQELKCLFGRIRSFRSKIHQMDSIDTEMKVNMLFALGAHIDKGLLNELRKDADLEVDWKNRIVEYKAKDGGLELDGDHTQSAKVKEGWKQRKIGSDGSKSPKPIPKTPGSTKRSAPEEVPKSSKRARVKSLNSAPDGILESKPRQPPNSPLIQQLLRPKRKPPMDILAQACQVLNFN